MPALPRQGRSPADAAARAHYTTPRYVSVSSGTQRAAKLSAAAAAAGGRQGKATSHPSQAACRWSAPTCTSRLLRLPPPAAAGASATAPATAAAEAALAAGPVLSWQHPTTGTRIHVFGVEHLQQEDHIGRYILAARPEVVLVETAATPLHGAATGNTLTCADQVPGAAGFFVRVFCQLAAALQEVEPEGRLSSTPWLQAAGNFNGEQLAYVAALTVGATLAYADRPKSITYRRLATLPSLEQLDAAYSAEVAAMYAGMLGAHAAPQQQQQLAAQQETAVWAIQMKEREVVMCAAVDAACTGRLTPGDTPPNSAAGAPEPASAAAAAAPPKEVVLVVGDGHLPGLEALWSDGSWRQLLGSDDLTSSPLMDSSSSSSSSSEQQQRGVYRGLLSAVLQLSVPPEVLQDLEDHLPALPEAEEVQRQGVFETYSSHRMQLAALPAPLLQQVCGAVKGVDLEEVLQPLRELRPMNGGPGWNEDMVMQLRALNFELEGNSAEE